MKIINVENESKKNLQSSKKNSFGNNILYSSVYIYTFICLVSHFNTLELFCLQIQFYSIPFHCIYYTSWESVHGMERLFRMYSVVRCISVYICNRQDKGKCCIVLSFISPLLFQPVLCFFFLFIYYLCVRHRWSMKFSCLFFFFLYMNCKVKLLIFFPRSSWGFFFFDKK